MTVLTSNGPPLEKKWKMKRKLFLGWNHTFSAWIWILHVLIFLLKCILFPLHKISKEDISLTFRSSLDWCDLTHMDKIFRSRAYLMQNRAKNTLIQLISPNWHQNSVPKSSILLFRGQIASILCMTIWGLKLLPHLMFLL